MVEHERLRRRREGDEPRREEDVPRLPEHALLALQRSAGNQAVARLMWDTNSQAVRVPKTYADRRVPWDGTRYALEDSTGNDPTLRELVKKHRQTILPYMAAGLHVPAVTGMVEVDDAALALEASDNVAESYEPGDVETGTSRLASTTARAHNRIMHFTKGQLYSRHADLHAEYVLYPEDFIAQEPDLPAANKDPYDEKIPNSKVAGATYWSYVCVLIALIFAEDYAAVQRVTGAKQPPTDLYEAVKELHRHYVTNNVQYDDSSARFRVMGDFGYRMAFGGRTSWQELPTWMEFTKGKKYIADIKGHTVKIECIQSVPKGNPINDPKQYFVPESDKENYATGDELALEVTAIWTK